MLRTFLRTNLFLYGALSGTYSVFMGVFVVVIVLFGAEFTCSLGEAFENRKAENEPCKVQE